MKIVQFAVPVSKDSVVIEEDVLPYFYNYFHRHDEMQISLVVKGEGTLIIDNYTQRFSAGDIYFIAANRPHIFQSDQSYFQNTGNDNAHAIHIYFDLKTITSALIDLPEMEHIKTFINNISYGIQIPSENAIEVAARMHKIGKSGGLPRLLGFIELLHYLSIDLKECRSLSSGSFRKPIPAAESIRINKIYQYTLEHYAEEISLDKVAGICYMTPQAFCKYFKKHTSKTYITFLQEIRINAACDKIIKGKFDGISSIAFATGFNSAINFNKVFKKVTGSSPRDYIRKFKVKEPELRNVI